MPVPEVASLAELNGLIAAACIRDLDRTIRGRLQPQQAREANVHQIAAGTWPAAGGQQESQR